MNSLPGSAYAVCSVKPKDWWWRYLDSVLGPKVSELRISVVKESQSGLAHTFWAECRSTMVAMCRPIPEIANMAQPDVKYFVPLMAISYLKHKAHSRTPSPRNLQ